MKKILVIFDGGGDLPNNTLGGKTPFEIAETPNLDFFARSGELGYMYPISENIVPGSDNSLLAIFGNNFKEGKRGVLESVGAGFELKRGDLALRTNFGTIDNLKNRKVIDRRAGRTLTSKEAKALTETINKKIKIKHNFKLKSTVQHRGVLVLRGSFSENVSPIDSEWLNPGSKEETFKFSSALDNDELSKYTANMLNDFIYQANIILNNHPVNIKRIKKGLFPANMIFMRGAGTEKIKLKQYRKWMSINSMPLEVGIAKLSGMRNFSFGIPKMKSIDVYKNLYNSLNLSIKFAIKTIKKNHKNFSGCYIHFKETDVPGHDNKPNQKKKMIEIIDRNFFGYLKKFVEKNYSGKKGKDGLKIVVTCDHSTPCKLKRHSADPVPVLVYGEDKDETVKFCEKESFKGILGKIYGKEFMKNTGLE